MDLTASKRTVKKKESQPAWGSADTVDKQPHGWGKDFTEGKEAQHVREATSKIDLKRRKGEVTLFLTNSASLTNLHSYGMIIHDDRLRCWILFKRSETD